MEDNIVKMRKSELKTVNKIQSCASRMYRDPAHSFFPELLYEELNNRQAGQMIELLQGQFAARQAVERHFDAEHPTLAHWVKQSMPKCSEQDNTVTNNVGAAVGTLFSGRCPQCSQVGMGSTLPH